MFKINLVPEVQEQKLKLKRINTYSTFFAVGFFGVAIFAILLFGGILLAKKAELSATNERIASIESGLKDYKELEETVLSLEKGLAGVKQILDGEKNLGQVFTQLEKITPSDVAFKSLKLTESTIEADVEAGSIDSLGKLFTSYKEFKVVQFSGSGKEGETVSLSIDEGTPLLGKVKSNGSWKIISTFDPNTDHTIKITVGETKITAAYTAATKAVTSDEGSISAISKNFFTSLDSTQYQKEGVKVKSNIKGTFEGSLLW